jgi:AAA domain
VNGRLPWPWIDEEKAVPWIEKRGELQLADSQRVAIRLAVMAQALVITGGPGVGKTTIVNSILKIPAAKGVRLLLCAPTGRAAKRMTIAGVPCESIRWGDGMAASSYYYPIHAGLPLRHVFPAAESRMPPPWNEWRLR